MKQSLLSFMMTMSLASVAMAAWSQILVLEPEEADDAIAVVGYFCKNDTMTYRQTHNKYKIQGSDTTVSESYEEEFMIVVTDSTSDGYKMKYVPLSFTLHDADTVTSLMTNAMSQLMQSVVCEFTTDELGLLKSITNWREIRDQLKKGVKVTCDTLYATIPDMDSIMPESRWKTSCCSISQPRRASAIHTRNWRISSGCTAPRLTSATRKLIPRNKVTPSTYPPG